MVHREQEIKQLQGWAQTVLNLITKFEDGLKELGPLAAIEEADSRPSSPDEEFPSDEEVPSAVATARALTNRARDLTSHRQGIAKLRQHFSKVGTGILAGSGTFHVLSHSKSKAQPDMSIHMHSRSQYGSNM